MAAGVITVVTIYDEVKAACNFNADNTDVSAGAAATTYLTEAIVNRLIYKNIRGLQTTITFDLAAEDGTAASQIFFGQLPFYWYLLKPTFSAEDDVNYTMNATGSIEVTSGTPTATQIAVTATAVDFALLMVDIFRYLGNHMAREAQQNYGPTSVSFLSASQQLMNQASYWSSEHFIHN